MIFMLAQGTGRAVYQSVVTAATTLRNSFNITDDPTATAGPSPTVRLPPAPPTLTALPPTAVVTAMCDVPDLLNYQYNAAVAEWQNYGFSAGTLSKPANASSTFPIGSQSLVAGSRVVCSGTTMSVGPKQCAVPDLRNQAFASARDGAWLTAGFRQTNLQRPADSTESFNIVSQQYASGSAIDCESTMQVEPEMCTVPYLVGRVFNINGTGSANTLWDDDFPAANLTRAAGMPDSFTIATQSLSSGSVVYCEAAMEVKPNTCTVPNLVGAQFLGAQTSWSNSGFSNALQKAANTPSDFPISTQSLPAGQQVACGGTTMTVQPNMCTVPNMVGKLYSVAATEWKQAPNNFTSNLRQPATVAGDFTITGQLTAAGTVLACASEVFVQPNMCTVPDMINKTFSQAGTAWGASGAKFTGSLQNPFNLSGSTQIKSQQYSAGESRLCTDTMWVKPQVCTVPNLAGQMYDSVKDNGEAFKNACGSSATLNNSWGGGNRRIGATNPVAGSEIVYNGSATASEQMCTTPNLAGMTFTNASTKWTQDQFTVALTRGTGAPGSGEFTVSTQSLAAGSSQLCSSIMSVAPTLCSVPNMVGQTVTNAKTLWSSAGFTLSNLGPGSLNSAHKVTAQTLTQGQSLACSSSVTLTAIDGTPVVTVNVPSNNSSASRGGNGPRVEATAYDPEVASGARGISKVVFTFKSPSGTTYTTTVNAGSSTKYCAFGGTSTCSRGFNPTWNTSLATGAWEITATAYPVDTTKGTVTSTVIRFTVNN